MLNQRFTFTIVINAYSRLFVGFYAFFNITKYYAHLLLAQVGL